MAVSPTIIITLNLAISWGLLVLIWLVQLIIYPGFQRIPSNQFKAYHRWYVKRISAVVIPLMLVELLVTTWMFLAQSGSPASAISMFLVFIVWLSTFAIQVPIHKGLKNGKDEILIRRLVVSNWIRTLAWSIKAAFITQVFISSAI